jgi:hypothetical protein
VRKKHLRRLVALASQQPPITSVSLLRIRRIPLVLRDMDALAAILPVQVSSRRRRVRLIPVEKHGHLLKRVPARFRVVQVNDDAHDEQHRHEHEVVPPSNRLQRDRVDEDVEEDGDEGGAPGHGQAAGAQAVRPDLAGVGAEEGGPGV